jgi:hypothetical protein
MRLDDIIGGGSHDPTTPEAARRQLDVQLDMQLPHQTLRRLHLQVDASGCTVLGSIRRLTMRCKGNGVSGLLLIEPCNNAPQVNAIGICTDHDERAVTAVLQKLPGVSLQRVDTILPTERHDALSSALSIWCQIQLELSGEFCPVADMLLDVRTLQGAIPGDDRTWENGLLAGLLPGPMHATCALQMHITETSTGNQPSAGPHRMLLHVDIEGCSAGRGCSDFCPSRLLCHAARSALQANGSVDLSCPPWSRRYCDLEDPESKTMVVRLLPDLQPVQVCRNFCANSHSLTR